MELLHEGASIWFCFEEEQKRVATKVQRGVERCIVMGVDELMRLVGYGLGQSAFVSFCVTSLVLTVPYIILVYDNFLLVSL